MALGAEGPISAVGYVFDENWAARNLATVRGFVAASRDAKELLRTSDAEWEALREMTGAVDDATLAALRDGFREDRKSVGEGKCVSERVDPGGRRHIKKKQS